MLFYLKKISMHEVGFEPTRFSPCVLETHPLDHSGIHAFLQIYKFFIFILFYRPVEPNPPEPRFDSPNSDSLSTKIG